MSRPTLPRHESYEAHSRYTSDDQHFEIRDAALSRYSGFKALTQTGASGYSSYYDHTEDDLPQLSRNVVSGEYKQHFGGMEQFSHMQEPEDDLDDWSFGWGKPSKKNEAKGQQAEEHSTPNVPVSDEHLYAIQKEERLEPVKRVAKMKDDTMAREIEALRVMIKQQEDARIARVARNMHLLPTPFDRDGWRDRGPHKQQDEKPEPIKEVVVEKIVGVEKKDKARFAREEAITAAEIAKRLRAESEAQCLDSHDTADPYSRHPADLILSVSGMTVTMRAVLEAHHLRSALELGRTVTRDDQCLANAFSVL
jgi:hypothetical protein